MKITLLAGQHSIHTHNAANGLAELGNTVEVITIHDGTETFDPRVSVIRLPFRPMLGYFTAAPAVRRRLVENPPDVLNAHFASGYGLLARLAGFHPLAMSVWGSDVYEFPERTPLHAWLLRGNLRAADEILSTSEAMARRTNELVPHERILVTPFGIDTERFQPRANDAATKGRNEIVVGTVKTLASTYGIDILLQAFARLRSTLSLDRPEVASRLRLTIFGGGPDRADLEDLATELGIDAVTTFPGKIPHESVPSALHQIDVFVAASRRESFGVAILEASACGIPVIVSDVGGLPEVVRDGITGFVVPRESPEAVAEALGRLVVDPALRARMGSAGREHVLETYERLACLRQLEGALARVAASGRSG